LPAVSIKRGLEVYKAVYGKDLKEEIGKKCSEGAGWFSFSNYYKEAMLRLCEMPVDLYCKALNDSMAGFGTTEDLLSSLVCTFPENMYSDIHKTYEAKYGRTLLNHIEKECSWSYKTALLWQAASWPESRAMSFRKAIQGCGTNEDQLIRIVIATTMAQRGLIDEAYKNLYKKGLIAAIDEDTSGDFCDILTGVLDSKEPKPDDDFDFDAECDLIRSSMDGGGEELSCDKNYMVKILSSKTAEQIQILCKKFEEKNGFSLYDFIAEEGKEWGESIFGTSNFRECILGLLRPPLEALAFAVRDCIVGFGTDETGLVTCLVHLSERRRKELYGKYMEIKYGGCLYEHLKGDTSGSFETALLGLVQSAPETWAKAMTTAMKGLGTSDNLLINMMCVAKGRMDEVREAFRNANGKELAEWIDGDCSGDYKNLLIKLANREVYKFSGSDCMIQVPPPPSKEMAQYKFAKTFNKNIAVKRQAPDERRELPEEDLQAMGEVFMYYGKNSSCAPNMDRQGVWDLTNAVGFPPADDGEDLTATFREWDYSGSGEITWNDFAREMTERVNAPQHYNDPLPENPPNGAQ
jgi:hypothetical protein